MKAFLLRLLKQGILYSLLIVLFSCRSTEEMYNMHFTEKDKFNAPLNGNQSANVRSLTPLYEDDSIFTFLDRSTKMIRFWDLRTSSYVDSIDVNLFPGAEIQDYSIYNYDSIFLALNTIHMGKLHDYAVILIDRNKNEKAYANFEGAPVPLSDSLKNTNVDIDGFCLSYCSYTNSPLFYIPEKQAVISSLRILCNSQFPCDSGQSFTTGFVFFDSTKKYHPFPVGYKLEKEDLGNYPFLTQSLSIAHDKNGNVVYGVGYTSKLCKYNYYTNSVNVGNLKFAAFDTIPLPDKPYREESFDRYKPEFCELKYDSYKNIYFRIGRLPISEDDAPLLKSYAPYVVMCFDSNLNKIGEGLLPIGFAELIPYKNGFLSRNRIEMNERNNITFSYLEYSLEAMSVKDYRKSIEENKLSINLNKPNDPYTYLKSISGEKYTKFLMFQLESSCSACMDYFGDFLRDSIQVLGKKNIAVILASVTQSRFENYVEEHNLNNFQGKGIFYAPPAETKKIIPVWANLKVMRFDRKGRIIEDEIYDGSNMHQKVSAILSEDK